MSPTFRSPGGRADSVSRSLPVLALVLLMTGCAPLAGLTGGENAKRFQEAKNLFDLGKYGEARTAYHELAQDRSDPGRAEQAQFNEAYVLVYYKNPGRDYGGAAREFEEFLARYPSGALAGEAQSWLDVLKSSDQSKMNAFKVNELLNEVDALTLKAEGLAGELEKARNDGEAAVRDRDRVLAEENNLMKRIDELLNEKNNLLGEKAALIRERDGLAGDKIGLEKKVARLTVQKESLVRSKQKLEKSLHDLRMLDVKMEEKRRK